MTLATICRSIALRTGTPDAGAWIGNADDTAAEIVEFSREALRMVADAFDWQRLTRSFTGTYAPPLAMPADFGRFVPGTVWVEGNTFPARGPLTEVEWADIVNFGPEPAHPVFRVLWGGGLATPGLDFYGAPAGAEITFRYITNAPVLSADATPIRRETWAADNDSTSLDERLIVLAGVGLWRDAKGLPTEVAWQQFAMAMAAAKRQERPLPVMGMDGDSPGTSPHAREVPFTLNVSVLG